MFATSVSSTLAADLHVRCVPELLHDVHCLKYELHNLKDCDRRISQADLATLRHEIDGLREEIRMVDRASSTAQGFVDLPQAEEVWFVLRAEPESDESQGDE
jgi:hypothetical protein